MMKSPDAAAIHRFREMIVRRLGLEFDDCKRDFLAAVLQRRIAMTKCDNAHSYFQFLNGELSAGLETTALAQELTVGETYFFRHPDQFRAFTEVGLLSQLRTHVSNSQHRILSAGCASGEEAYTVAMLLSQHAPEAACSIARVIGIDVNIDSLAKAVQAKYSAWALRGMPEDFRKRYLRGDKIFVLDDAIRKMVSFENRNLMDDDVDFWQPERFDVIFCRNVMMYFTAEAARIVIARLTSSLVRGGFLFLGPAETLRGISQDYHLRHTHETFYYQRRFEGEDSNAPILESCVKSPAAETYFPMLASEDASWVGSISKASERIACLSRAMPASSRFQDVQSAPKDRSIDQSHRSSSLDLQSAREMVRQERFNEALSVLRSMSANDGNDPDVQLLHAVILTNCGEVAEAEQLCDRVLAGDELNAEARYLLALCREYRTEFEAAIEQDQTAIYLDRQFAMPHLHLGLLCKRIADWQGARVAFQEARVLLPREDAARILLFGGGFSREMLIDLCEAELAACRGSL